MHRQLAVFEPSGEGLTIQYAESSVADLLQGLEFDEDISFRPWAKVSVAGWIAEKENPESQGGRRVL